MKNRTISLLLLGLISVAFATTTQAQAPEQATQFQINTTHTGSITVENLTPPLTQQWVVNFGRPISYPLIADGKVFVTVKDSPNHGTTLFALDATNGAVVWSSALGGDFWWSASCYENGRVFALNGSGLLRAFDGATGNVIWSRLLAGSFAVFDSAPTVFQGVVYVSGSLNVYAISANTGGVLWTSSVINGDTSSPAVTSEGVWVSYACPNVYKLDPATGAKIWHYAPGCSGGGGKTPALYDGRLYVRDTTDTIFDAATGTIIGNFQAKNTPAFAGTRGFFLNGPHGFGSFGTLEARDVSTNSVLWSFAGDGRLQSAVLVVNDYVYVGSETGKLYAVDAATGQQVWSTTAGTSIPYVDEHNISQPLTSFAAGEGLLVVPTATTLVAYKRSPPDLDPPSTSIIIPGISQQQEWFNAPITVTLIASDALSGVANTFYTINGGPTQTYSNTFSIESDGVYTIEYWSVDDVGNTEARKTRTVRIDSSAPLTEAVATGTAGTNGWYRSGVQVSLSANDNLSGVQSTFYQLNGGATQTYAGPFVISAQGQHIVEYWSVDNLNNVESNNALAINIDSVGPAVTASANPSTAPKRPQPVTVTISGSVTDAMSGVSSASFNVIDEYGVTQPSGPVTVQANGTYSFTLTLPATKQGGDKNGHLYTIVVTGRDQAGNSATATTTLTIN